MEPEVSVPTLAAQNSRLWPTPELDRQYLSAGRPSKVNRAVAPGIVGVHTESNQELYRRHRRGPLRDPVGAIPSWLSWRMIILRRRREGFGERRLVRRRTRQRQRPTRRRMVS